MNAKVPIRATGGVDVLLRAAALIEERGWVRGRLIDDETGAVCALGAINLACYGNARGGKRAGITRRSLYMEASACAVVEVRRRAPHLLGLNSDSSIARYNDRVARDRRAIVGFLRAAAKRCKGEGK